MSIVWQSLFANVALIAILMLLWELVSESSSDTSPETRSLLFGTIMGFGAVVSMLSGQEIIPGVYSDLRGPMIGVAAWFGGIPAALISTAMAMIARFAIGGQGVTGAIAGIAIIFLIGLFANRNFSRTHAIPAQVIGFSLLLPVAQLAGYLIQPSAIWLPLLRDAGLPLASLSFITTILVVMALFREAQRRELIRGNLIYRAMVEELPDCLNVKDLEGRFVVANPPTAELMRAPNQEALIGKSDFDFYPKELAEQFRKDELSVLETGEVQRFDQKFMLPSGRAGWLSTLKAPLRDETGKIIGVITHNRDVTERRKAEQVKNEFVSTVSHELRTPLTSIRGALGLVMAGTAGKLPDKAEGLLKIAQNSSERLVRLINDILDIEKMESGRLTFEMKRVKLRPVVEQAIAATASYQGEKNVRTIFVDDAPGAEVMADADRLTQVLTNLLSNAIKYSPAKGVISVDIAHSSQGLMVTVKDKGGGIPKEFHSRIFGKFEQADSSTTRASGGTGLGLNIAKSIIERMKGTIGFESVEGEGSSFFFVLPDVTIKKAVRTTAASSPAKMNRQPHILIVEDEPDVAAIIANMVAEAGFASDVAPDLASAESLLKSRRYDAVTLDILLEGENGSDLLRLMRDEGLQMPVIVISARADETRQSLSGSAVNILDWMGKPVDQGRLKTAMTSVLKQRAQAMPRILHVDDDRAVLEIISSSLGTDVSVRYARSLAEARQALNNNAFDLVILDIGLPDGSGLELLEDLPERTSVILFSAAELEEDLSGKVMAVMTKTKASEIDVAMQVRSLLPGLSEAGPVR